MWHFKFSFIQIGGGGYETLSTNRIFFDGFSYSFGVGHPDLVSKCFEDNGMTIEQSDWFRLIRDEEYSPFRYEQILWDSRVMSRLRDEEF